MEYDGTDFSGFQWQPDTRTIAGELEAAFAKLFGTPAKVTGAGRTDSGVHATGQVVSLGAPDDFPLERLAPALRGLLPSDLSVREYAAVEPGFSARFSAIEREYVYAILNRPARSALLARYAHHVPQPLDLDAMRTAARALVGERDFRSFAAAPGDGPTIRNLRHLALEPQGELLRVEATADGFLHHMVRTIVGTLLECGTGRRNPAEIRPILEAEDRAAAGMTAPAHGLYLAGVRYPDGYDSFSPPPVLSASKGA